MNRINIVMYKFKFCFLVLLLMALNSITSAANDFAVNGIFYSVINDSEVTVTGGWSDSGILNIPETVNYQGATYTVTSIDESAYRQNYDLLIVSIPNSVVNIGAEAFRECTNLSSIAFGNSVAFIDYDAFEGCNCLTSVKISDMESWLNIRFENQTANPLYYAKRLFLNEVEVNYLVVPETINEIGNFAFINCTSLQRVSLPNSVKSIGDDAFEHCTNLTSVYISDLLAWCQIDFSNASSNPLYYARRLFLNDAELTDLVIPGPITEIGLCAFRSCSSLKSVTIHNSVTSIGSAAFAECSGLTSIVIPNSVTTMGRSAFQGCTNLTDATLNGPEIGDYAFKECTGLANLTINNSVTKIGSAAFEKCSSLTNVKIPNSITSISDYAFNGCSSLTTINVESDNPKFDSRNNCNSIIETTSNTLIVGCKNSTIPNSVKVIGMSAFRDCNGLTNIIIPNSVTTIGSTAFEKCYYLANIICQGLTPPTMSSSYTFSDYVTPTLYVPRRSLALYQTTDYWNRFTTIVPIEEENVQDRLYIEDFTITPGETRTVSVMLDNEIAYTAFQTDIYMPAGLTIEMEDGDYIFDLTDRKSRDHMIASQPQVDGAIRVISYSNKINPFSGNSGALVTFNVTAATDFTDPATIALCNTLFTTTAGVEIAFGNENCTVSVPLIGIKGDVNGDGSISISDVTALIDYLLSGNANGISLVGADCNTDGSISISDVTALIDYLLSGSWPISPR